MKKTSHTFLAIFAVLALPHSAEACKILANVKQHELKNIPRAEIMKCIAEGHDPNWQFRNNNIGMAPTGQFEKFQTFYCDPSGVCKNSTGERTELSELPPGYQPQNNPNLNIPEIPWKDIEKTPLPCGAVGSLSQLALQTMWGNVSINLPPQAKTLINAALSKLLDKLFGKKTDCQDGKLWGTINNLINVILPMLGLKAPGFVFDRSNNTFLAPPNTLLGVPKHTTFIVDLGAGGANFDLPVGGSFTDANGQKITLNANTNVQFTADGNAITSDGGNYKVTAGGLVTLDPNGVVGIPKGTPIPVPPETTLFPMGPITKAPAWASN
jgi:hypothetical protein